MFRWLSCVSHSAFRKQSPRVCDGGTFALVDPVQCLVHRILLIDVFVVSVVVRLLILVRVPLGRRRRCSLVALHCAHLPHTRAPNASAHICQFHNTFTRCSFRGPGAAALPAVGRCGRRAETLCGPDEGCLTEQSSGTRTRCQCRKVDMLCTTLAVTRIQRPTTTETEVEDGRYVVGCLMGHA
jgi:hypothetical protein